MTDPTIKHLASNHIDQIALQLDEDTYGASGDLSDLEIKERLIATIDDMTNYQYHENRDLLWAVAGLILGVWEHKDRQCMEEIARTANRGSAP